MNWFSWFRTVVVVAAATVAIVLLPWWGGLLWGLVAVYFIVVLDQERRSRGRVLLMDAEDAAALKILADRRGVSVSELFADLDWEGGAGPPPEVAKAIERAVEERT